MAQLSVLVNQREKKLCSRVHSLGVPVAWPQPHVEPCWSLPGLINPSFSASLIMDNAKRSFTLLTGLLDSSFAAT